MNKRIEKLHYLNDGGAGGSISFNTGGLSSVLSDFEEIQSQINNTIANLRSALQTIDSNWSGPQHMAASADKSSAESHMDAVTNTLSQVDEAITDLMTNANNVKYE